MSDTSIFDRSDESLLYAFSALLGKLGIEVNMAQLREQLTGQDLNFESLAKGENIHIVEKGDYGSWPASNNAIIKFQFQDREQPYIEVNGQRDANIIDHYCLVADFEQKTIIDSADGVIKDTNLYGHPVSWAMFEAGTVPKVVPQPKIDTERSYRVLTGGESGWRIAQKLGLDAKDLKEHNIDEFKDFSNIPAGTILHLPVRLETKPSERQTEFEFLRRALPMHIINPKGARKRSFGHVKKLEDISETGPSHSVNKNLNIFAIAHVPLGDKIVPFYMESDAIDSVNKKVKWTVGFHEDDIAEGHTDPNAVEKPVIQPAVAKQLEAANDKIMADQLAKKAAAAERLAIMDDADAEDFPPSRRQGSESLPVDDPEYSVDWWKNTYKPFPGRKPQIYVFNYDLDVQDFADKSKTKPVQRLEGVRIGGEFTNPDRVECWRPQDAVDSRTWYGIPKINPETGEPNMISEDELYNTHLPLSERATMRHGRLSVVERYITVPLAKATAQSRLLQRYAHKFKQNKE
jgi:hypothetical protein